jgi:hypothetical protein
MRDGKMKQDDTKAPDATKRARRETLWAERRAEQSAFVAERRMSRCKTPLDNMLSDADRAGLWDDRDYSIKKYQGSVPTDIEIAAAEAELGYRLPSSYKQLIKLHNGGLLLRNHFVNPFRRERSAGVFSVKGLYGIDPNKPYSLLGNMGSTFWISEWGYPDVGVAICDTSSGGHGMIFLDYSDCGVDGETCVVSIDQEADYEVSYLADDFAAFVRGLITKEASYEKSIGV